jgi:hypothetical protein
MDVYHDGKQIRSEEVFPPMPASDASTFAEDHLNQHAERYINSLKHSRDQEPMTDEALEDFADAMDEQGEQLREGLAEDLGGDSDDYRTRPVADGGE